MCRLKIIAIGGCCKTPESNENSSSKIEEVPEGRRSMIVQNILIINIINRC